MSLMGLDIGTTGTKAIVFNLDGNIISQAYREYPLIYPKPGWIELDPKEVWQKVKEALQEANSGARSDPVKAFAISCLGEACVPITKDKEILDRSIIGFDPRGNEEAEWWEERTGKREVMDITGQPITGITTINKLMWWRTNKPQVFNKAWKFLCYEDFAFFMMGLPPTVDYSIASRMMCLDIRKKSWSERLLGLADINENLLAEPVASGTVVDELSKETCNELGFSPGVRGVTGGHDQPAGALGAGIIREGLAMNATGTVECITPCFSKPVLNEEMVNHNYCCYPHVVPDMYVTLAYNFTGGSLLRWYRDTLAKEEKEEAERAGKDVYDIIIGRATKEPTNLFILPHFTMTGTPYFDSNSKGAIIGLTLATRKGDIAKAVLEGITYEMMMNIDYLDRAGVRINELRAIGGGAKSPIWLQLKADMFGKRILSLNVSEAACLGDAILAGVAIGEYDSIERAVERVVKKIKEYNPNPKRKSIYKKKLRIYEGIYPALKELSHKI